MLESEPHFTSVIQTSATAYGIGYARSRFTLIAKPSWLDYLFSLAGSKSSKQQIADWNSIQK